ncbi:MAG: OmpA/MotB family protein [Planctomycetota bacterium]|jgi:flagellar motor protein MotB
MTTNGFTHTRTFSRLAIASLAICSVALTGCKSSNESASLLEQENIELRAQNRNLQTSLDAAEQDRALLQGELRAIQADNDRLRTTGNTGFENIQGVTAGVSSTGEVVVTVTNDVLFASGSATLRNQAKQTLDQIASVLNSQYGGKTIRIGGHTDTDPIKRSAWKTNERLSAERALAVEEYLASKGLSNDAMYVAGFGPAYPRGDKAQSRRVEIVVLADN